MEIFSLQYNNQHIQIIADKSTGNITLAIDGIHKSQLELNQHSHQCVIPLNDIGDCIFSFDLDIQNQSANVNITNQNGENIHQSNNALSATVKNQQKEGNKLFSAATIGLLIKSSKVFKVLLIASSAAAYSILFSWQFAIVLLAILIFHEYGHVFAMKRCGLKTKGIYLIPFFGGMAVSERAKSNWHEVYISMMGPVFGLIMSIVAYLIFLFTNNHFVGLIAGFSALLNLFNLLPIYPLDGGHVVKAIVFSFKRYWGFVLLMALSAAGFAFAYIAGWYFINFFIVIGFLDLAFSWKRFSQQNIEPLNKYGMIFSLVWYIATLVIFIGIIFLMVSSKLPGTELLTQILSS